MNLIWRNGSGLTKLSLDFGDETFSLPAASLLQPMAALPLKHVCLIGPFEAQFAQLNNIASIWPTVSQLELRSPHSVFGFDDLRNLTNLPHLRHLVLNLDGDTDLLSYPLTPTLLALETFELSGLFDIGPDLSTAAQYLLSLWPNLQQVHWSLLDARKLLDDEELGESRAKAKTLNRLISLQHDVDKIKTCVIEQYGLGVLDRMFR
ncbi:hypothetical protein FRC08_005539 [Ceratobasidium sp. 394]|nr:hypothetical protein FRC08_005539 [Ceratobasidium sp. 394]